MEIYTIGHSNRSIEVFLDTLKAYGITQLVDIRTVPKSRHNPQFNDESISESLRQSGIRYFHLEALWGLRHAKKDSGNLWWRNASFRGYADYMQTEEFEKGISELVEISMDGRTAIMCAEAVPWRCHRSLVADALLVKGIDVWHIMDVKHARKHALISFAKVEGERVWYPGEW